MTSLNSLVDRDRVRADAAYGTSVPDGWPTGTHPWRVTLRRSGRRLTVDFHTGPAITEEPSAADVLHCLTNDVSSGELTFTEFCEEFGYDEDNRSAYATWEKCAKLAPRVRRFLGDAFDEYADAEH